MSQHRFGARHTLQALTGFDFGLRVRVQPRPPQSPLFPGTEKLSVPELTVDLTELVGSLRVYSYALRGQLETVVSALQLNVECRCWCYAKRAALDLAGLLSLAAKRRQADRSHCLQAANAALHLAKLCGGEVR